MTAIDGYQMARKGKAGAALAIAAIGSFFAGTVSTFLVAIFAPPLTAIALEFGAAEYFSLMVVGLVSSIALAHGSIVKALARSCSVCCSVWSVRISTAARRASPSASAKPR